MKIFSIRQGFECDHSTRDYGYISGVDVHYDYGTFDMKFSIPYNTEVSQLLKKFPNIDSEKKFNKIVVEIYLYCDSFNEDEQEYVELALSIRKAIMNKDLEVLEIIDSYHGKDEGFQDIRVETPLGKRLQKVLTPAW